MRLTIQNYVVTSNHVHLLIVDYKDRMTIPKAIQLTAGRIAQEYNQKKKRKGAYWEDRYHATAIETGSHLLRCLVYIDLNMVRAGVVSHPSKWIFGGLKKFTLHVANPSSSIIKSLQACQAVSPMLHFRICIGIW
ncbi:transposase [Desulfospira joergensenii]|uniref:transposase n=1 Tax=Desulfospira joergensenii TaxID=53329 RepID=UPI001FC9A81A